MNENNSKCDYTNSKALYVLKIITMSFAILACIVVATAMLTRWIIDLERKIKESGTKVAKAAARLNRFRKARIKHILKQRKLQLKEEKKEKRTKTRDRDKKLVDMDADYEDGIIEEISDDENAINDFDSELSNIIENFDDDDE